MNWVTQLTFFCLSFAPNEQINDGIGIKMKGKISSAWTEMATGKKGKCWASYHKTTIIMISDKRFVGVVLNGKKKSGRN